MFWSGFVAGVLFLPVEVAVLWVVGVIRITVTNRDEEE
jgi:hypothetical protein